MYTILSFVCTMEFKCFVIRLSITMLSMLSEITTDGEVRLHAQVICILGGKHSQKHRNP